MPAPAETLTLYYFGEFKGLVEQCRLVAELGGVKYDFRPVQDWAKEKYQTPFGQVPVLIVKDASGKETQIAQTTAINRFLAKRGGLYPPESDAVGQGLVDSVVEACTELRTRIGEYFRAPDDQKEAVKARLATELVPPFAASLARLLQQKGNTGYFWKEGTITPAEISVHMVVGFLKYLGIDGPASGVNAPALAKVSHNIENHPRTKAYYASDRSPKEWSPSPEWLAKFKTAIETANKAAAAAANTAA